MTTPESSTHKRHVSTSMQSPVGTLTLVATDDGLAAILWQNDRPGRVRLNITAEESRHPVLVDTERQLGEYFAGQRTQLRPSVDIRRQQYRGELWYVVRDNLTNAFYRIRPGARRFLLGSVPNKISHHAPCDVWIVRTT